MKSKRLLIALMACATCALLCACPPTPVDTRGPDPDNTTISYTTFKKEMPDYGFMISRNINADPAPSTFEELKSLTYTRKDRNTFYREDEEHQRVDLVFRRTKIYAARFENARKFFEEFFGIDSTIDFVKDDQGRLIIKEENHNGPEGMTETHQFRVFVDPTGKFIALAEDPYIPDSDLNDLFSMELVSVKEFREFYSMTESKIEDEYVKAYIERYNISRYDLSADNHGEKLDEIVTYGMYYKLGYSVRDNLSFKDIGMSEDKFISNAAMVIFDFEFPVPNSDETKIENILFDIKNNKVYLNANLRFYREAEKCVTLKQDVLKSIQEDLIKNVGPDDGNKYHDLKYSYNVYIIDSEGKHINYSSRARNDVNSLFDAYWRKLYKKCFGKDHKLNTKSFDPSQNENKRLYSGVN